jgi:hypothetical protein
LFETKPEAKASGFLFLSLPADLPRLFQLDFGTGAANLINYAVTMGNLEQYT